MLETFLQQCLSFSIKKKKTQHETLYVFCYLYDGQKYALCFLLDEGSVDWRCWVYLIASLNGSIQLLTDQPLDVVEKATATATFSGEIPEIVAPLIQEFHRIKDQLIH